MKRVPRPARLFQDNLDANQPFPKAVLVISAIASAFCGWRHQGRRDNQMAAQHGRETESATRHHTAKRMIIFILLRRRTRLDSNGSKRRRTVCFNSIQPKITAR
jgi:hypothetical protein